MSHILALQVLIPFFGAIFAAACFNRFYAYIIGLSVAILSSVVSLAGLMTITSNISYVFGDWLPSVGIEYRSDYETRLIVMFINLALLYLLTVGNKIFLSSVIDFIKPKWQHLFYPILLFAHAGYIGICSTYDLFNLYVFIEISSLSTYILMSSGANKLAPVGAFNYLIYGSIGATLILVGIGIIFSITGHLNITEIAAKMSAIDHKTIPLVGAVFLMLGSMIKVGVFPLHFWITRCYNYAPTILLTYFASISTLIATCILAKSISATNISELLPEYFNLLVQVIGMLSMIVCGYIACTTQSLKQIFIYSCVCQSGYLLILYPLTGLSTLLLQFVLVDGCNKIMIFLLIAYYDHGFYFYKSATTKILTIVAIASSIGLPITGMFIIKLHILELLLRNSMIVQFVAVILTSVFSMLYHYRIADTLLQDQESQDYKNNSVLSEIIPLVIFSNAIPYIC